MSKPQYETLPSVLTEDMVKQLQRLQHSHPLVSSDFGTQALLGKAGTARRTYQSRLNQAADIWGFTMSVPDSLKGKERQAQLRDRYKLVPWHEVRAPHVEYLKQVLIDSKKSYRTINVTLSAVRAVVKKVFLYEQMSGDDLKRIESIKGVTGSRLPSGRNVSPGEINAITEACARDPSDAGVRDQSILALLYACGLRRREVAALKVEDINFKERLLKFTGKGNKQRHNFPDKGTWSALEDWLAIRKACHVQLDAPLQGPLFCPVNKGGRINPNKGLTDQSIYNAVIKRLKEAKLGDTATPHDLRRSFATYLLKEGKDLKMVADLMGHSSVDTTAIYDLRGDEDRRDAQSAMYWPYRESQRLIK